MPFVSCNANGCIYNCDRQCGLDDLRVSGEEAMRSGGTCCDSFRADGCCEDPHPDEFSSVACSAGHCRHNHDGMCEAGSIDISGKTARCSDQTACASFCK